MKPYLRPLSSKAYLKYSELQANFVCLVLYSDLLYDLQVKIGDEDITAAIIGRDFTLVRYHQPCVRASTHDWFLVQWRDENGRFIPS